MVKTVQSKIAVMIDRVERLRRLSDKINTFNAYSQSADLKDLTERNLQIAIEACFDIGKIIISQKMFRDPKDNKDIFVILAEAGIIGLQSLEFLTPMAGTRNILVHGYDKVDDALIYGILKRHLDDFDIFLTEIRDNYLSKT